MPISFADAARVQIIVSRGLAASPDDLLDASTNCARVAEHLVEALLAGSKPIRIAWAGSTFTTAHR